MIYSLPCTLDIKLSSFLADFGEPVYSVVATKLLRIDTTDGFHIEGRLGAKLIKFTMPKKFEKVASDKITKKIDFEKALVEWMIDKLDIDIEY
ncbi:MAG: hypothetical protein WC523_03750 [Patescibacteria group bacterium]